MQSKKILEGDAVLLSQPLLIEQFGRAGAQFLSQLHYWLNHNNNLGIVSDGAKWIYNSAKDWADQLCMSSRTVQRLISSLNTSGVLEVKKLSANKHNRTNHYTINYEILEKLIKHKASEKLITTKCRNALGQSDVMYIQRLPNKEFNKSEEIIFETSNSNQLSKNSFNQVKKFKNLNGKKSGLGYQLPGLSEIDRIEKSKFNNDIVSKQTSKVDVKEDSQKTNTAQAMLKAWNDTFEVNEKMSRDLAPLLVSAYNSKFSKNIELWHHYLLSIKSSAYLTSEKFNLSLFWALKFSIIDQIRAGEFGVKKEFDQEDLVGRVKTIEEVKLEINQIKNESVKAQELRHKILQAVGLGNYVSWFKGAQIQEQEGSLVLVAPNAFVENYWETHFDWILRG